MNNYPTGDHELLLAKLGISPKAKILDVGGGGNPFKYASVVVDRDFEPGNKHRDGCNISFQKSNVTYIRADIQSLPFKDNAFDFVICIHVLEHVEFPNIACEELMRVARKGFLETPRKWTEYYAGHPTHRWLIDDHDGMVNFEPVTYTDSPFSNFALHPLWDSEELGRQLSSSFPNIPCVQLAWEKRFNYKVSAFLPDKVKSKDFLAESHYCFARNLLKWMGGFDRGAFHAGIALQMVPESNKYLRLSNFYSALTGDVREVFSRKLGLKQIARALMLRVFRFVYLKILKRHRNIVDRL